MANDETKSEEGKREELTGHGEISTMPVSIPSRRDMHKPVMGNVVPLIDVDDDDESVNDVETLPVADIESWLGKEEIPTRWIKLRTIDARVLIKAVTEEERRKLRNDAPMIRERKTKQFIKDEEWIQIELVRRNILEPKIPSRAMLEKAMSGEVAYLATEISRISGFRFDSMGSDALD
jgi:hypothetical protein